VLAGGNDVLGRELSPAPTDMAFERVAASPAWSARASVSLASQMSATAPHPFCAPAAARTATSDAEKSAPAHEPRSLWNVTGANDTRRTLYFFRPAKICCLPEPDTVGGEAVLVVHVGLRVVLRYNVVSKALHRCYVTSIKP
jgi:hypothetical protein